MLDGGGWGRGKMRRTMTSGRRDFPCSTPPLSFLLPIIYPLGKTFFLSPVFHCMKNSRWRLNFLRCERSLEKISPALQAVRLPILLTHGMLPSGLVAQSVEQRQILRSWQQTRSDFPGSGITLRKIEWGVFGLLLKTHTLFRAKIA